MEIMKILIGYDGSLCADAALNDLARAGLPENVEVRLLSVAEVWLPAPSNGDAKDTLPGLGHAYERSSAAAKAAETTAENGRERLKAMFPSWQISAISACGSPAWELIFEADHWKPDLIVVGSHGRTALGRFVLGSVSQRILNEARCSVRIARGHAEVSNRHLRIVIGLDGSPGSKAAVKAVASRFWPQGTEVILVVVDDPFIPEYLGHLISPFTEAIAEDKEAERIWAKKISTEAAELLTASDLKVSELLKEGDPKNELPRVAEEWSADCVFVGSTGFSNRLERFVLGSVSAAVASRAHCTVEVVRETSGK